jgi:hypothetical protein
VKLHDVLRNRVGRCRHTEIARLRRAAASGQLPTLAMPALPRSVMTHPRYLRVGAGPASRRSMSRAFGSNPAVRAWIQDGRMQCSAGPTMANPRSCPRTVPSWSHSDRPAQSDRIAFALCSFAHNATNPSSPVDDRTACPQIVAGSPTTRPSTAALPRCAPRSRPPASRMAGSPVAGRGGIWPSGPCSPCSACLSSGSARLSSSRRVRIG